jgi:pilus assembly protein Flp/PilA
MLKLIRLITFLRNDQRGITAVEYAVLAAMVGAAIIAVGPGFEDNLGNAFTNIFNPS